MSRTHRLLVSSSLVAMLLSPAPLRAEVQAKSNASAKSESAGAQAAEGASDVVKDSKEAKELARQIYEKATTEFKVGQFESALKKYQRAYELAPLPGFLFNIGQCHMQLSNYDQAVFAFESFLREAPKDNSVRPEAEERLAMALFKQEEKALESEEGSSPAPTEQVTQQKFWIAIGSTAVVGAVVGSAITLGIVLTVNALNQKTPPDPTLGRVRVQ